MDAAEGATDSDSPLPFQRATIRVQGVNHAVLRSGDDKIIAIGATREYRRRTEIVIGTDRQRAIRTQPGQAKAAEIPGIARRRLEHPPALAAFQIEGDDGVGSFSRGAAQILPRADVDLRARLVHRRHAPDRCTAGRELPAFGVITRLVGGVIGPDRLAASRIERPEKPVTAATESKQLGGTGQHFLAGYRHKQPVACELRRPGNPVMARLGAEKARPDETAVARVQRVEKAEAVASQNQRRRLRFPRQIGDRTRAHRVAAAQRALLGNAVRPVAAAAATIDGKDVSTGGGENRLRGHRGRSTPLGHACCNIDEGEL